MSASQAKQLGVLFVCTGNICRSPTADGIFQALVNQKGLQEYFLVDSAGTHAEVGWNPDPRSIDIAHKKGVDLSALTARQFVAPQDFEQFDYIFAMDSGHYGWLNTRRPSDSRAYLSLFLEFAGTVNTTGDGTNLIVPDPYYSNHMAFDEVFNSIETGCNAILERLIEVHSILPATQNVAQ